MNLLNVCKDTVLIDDAYKNINFINSAYDKNHFKSGKFADV